MAWQLALSAAVVVCSLLQISVDYLSNTHPKSCNRDVGSTTESDNFGRDYFDELPDDILDLILSYLSMRDASKLRVLSRRWRYLNLFEDKINFDSCTMLRSVVVVYRRGSPCEWCHKRNLDRFIGGVNQYIKYWKGQSISSFRISFCLGKKAASEIDQWIKFAVRMGVQQLELSCGCFFKAAYDKSKYYPIYTFSTQLLSEASRLRYLSLRGCKLKSNFNGQFHSLRVLDLQYVLLSQCDLRHVLLKCLNLEELRLKRCKCPARLSINGPFLHLKYLLVEFSYELKEVELSATKLTTFEYYGCKLIEFNFVRVPNLENMFLGVPCDKGINYVFDDLSRHAPRLQRLSVAGPVFLVHRVPCSPITFRNVIKLEFHLWRFYDLHNVVFLLRTCPLVQNLGVMMSRCLDWEDARTMVQLQRTIHSELKLVEFGGFYGSETQIELVIYLLETAVGLKRMALSSKYHMMGLTGRDSQWFRSASFDKWKRESVIKRLLGKAASKSAEVILESFPIAI